MPYLWHDLYAQYCLIIQLSLTTITVRNHQMLSHVKLRDVFEIHCPMHNVVLLLSQLNPTTITVRNHPMFSFVKL